MSYKYKLEEGGEGGGNLTPIQRRNYSQLIPAEIWG